MEAHINSGVSANQIQPNSYQNKVEEKTSEEKSGQVKELNETQDKKKEKEYTDIEKAEIAKLKQVDQRVKAHENAHRSAAGRLAQGAPTYEYKTGPDNIKYAVGGEVQIDSSKVPDDPSATIQKAQKIRTAALAPADPSPQDLKVAAEARQMEAKARQELAKENSSEDKPKSITETKADTKSETPFDEKVKSAYTDQEEDSSFEKKV